MHVTRIVDDHVGWICRVEASVDTEKPPVIRETTRQQGR